MKTKLVFAGVAVAILFSTGCGGSDRAPAYADVAGTVTLGGKPLESGTITFSTDGRPPTTMDIINGEYTGQAMVGPNRIMISSKRKGTTAAKVPADVKARLQNQVGSSGPQDGGGQPQSDIGMVDVIPADWGTKSKQQRVVESGAPNKFDFAIAGK